MEELQRAKKYARIPTDGIAFEHYLADLLRDVGYTVQITPESKDFGADLILTSRKGMRHAVQAKYYNAGSIGLAPIQEVLASLVHWKADDGWVVTNGTFTKASRQLAKENGVRLIDGQKLKQLIDLAIDGKLVEENARNEASNRPHVKKEVAKKNRLHIEANEILRAFEAYADKIRGIALCYCLSDVPLGDELKNAYLTLHTEDGRVFGEPSRLAAYRWHMHDLISEKNTGYRSQTIATTDDEAISSKAEKDLKEARAFLAELHVTENHLETEANHAHVNLDYCTLDDDQLVPAVQNKIREYERTSWEITHFSDECQRISECCRLALTGGDDDENDWDDESYYHWVCREEQFQRNLGHVDEANQLRSEIPSLRDEFERGRANYCSIANDWILATKNDNQYCHAPDMSMILDCFSAVLNQWFFDMRKRKYQRDVKAAVSFYHEVDIVLTRLGHCSEFSKHLYDRVRLFREASSSDLSRPYLTSLRTSCMEGLVNVYIGLEEVYADVDKALEQIAALYEAKKTKQLEIKRVEDEKLLVLYTNEINKPRKTLEKLISRYQHTGVRSIKKYLSSKITENARTIQSINQKWEKESLEGLYYPVIPEELSANIGS